MPDHNRLARQRLEGDSTFRTGIVTPLGELFMVATRSIILQSESIAQTERTISQLWSSLPNVIQKDYVDDFIAEELLSTNEMEGIHSTKKEAETAVASAQLTSNTGDAKSPTPHSQVRFGEFAKLYLNLTDENTALPNTLDDLRDIYDRVTQGEIDADNVPDGLLFREKDVEIQRGDGTPIHKGVRGETRIGSLLTSMLALGKSDEIPALFRAIMTHFVFEYVHPFYDGNGRTGRYLLALYLRQTLALPTVLSLARTISDDKNRYYKAFSESEDTLNCGELTFFVSTMLSFVEHAQHDLLFDLIVKAQESILIRTVQLRLTQQHQFNGNTSRLLLDIMQRALFDQGRATSITEAAQRLALSSQTVRKACAALNDANLITITTRRPVRMMISQYLKNLLTDAAEQKGKESHQTPES